MSLVIRVKRGEKLQIENAILRVGELAFAVDTNELYIGGLTGKVALARRDLVNITDLGNILNLDGHGSELDADKLDGFHASQTSLPNTIPVADSSGLISTGWLPNSIRGFENPIDLTNATSDYLLQVGEVAKITFENAILVPLCIATQDGTYYEMHLIPSNTGGNSNVSSVPIYLYPNNTTYSNVFVYAELFRGNVGSGSSYFVYSAFRIGLALSDIVCFIINRTQYKGVKSYYNIYGGPAWYPCIDVSASNWRDTATPWTSLGTIVFSQASSGVILVRRLV